jgi:hypothetical protein
MNLTKQQAKAIYQFYKTMNHQNSYVTNLVAMGQNKEAECLARGIDKIAHIAKIEEYEPMKFPWSNSIKRPKPLDFLPDWIFNK